MFFVNPSGDFRYRFPGGFRVLEEVMVATKGSLKLEFNGFDFVCQDLAGIAKSAEVNWNRDEIISDIQKHIGIVVEAHRLRDETLVEQDEVKKRESVFAESREKFGPIGGALESFLFWLSDWWYYDRNIAEHCRSNNWQNIHKSTAELVEKHLVPLFPDQVKKNVSEMEIGNVAVGFGHFAVMFVDKCQKIRRIVTDTQLFELHNVFGYTYLDILRNGKPVMRCVTDRDGERAFFDGVRLMSHEAFQTCAPKTIVMDDGYKVNSTEVTIVNGVLYPLIDVDDAVAKTTGAIFGCCDFSRKQQIEACEMAEESAKRLSVAADGTISLDGMQWKPFGMFQPSQVTLLESGFSLYDWSFFHEIKTCQYSNVLIVDDKQTWADTVLGAFGKDVAKLQALVTSNKRAAVEHILNEAPGALILDMHLTDDEEFDGLFIANQLFDRGFRGDIFIASSYGDEALRAMQQLIKGTVHIPGKNIERIRECLFNRR